MSEAPHHSTINPIELNRGHNDYVYWVERLTADDLFDKADIAQVLGWYRKTLREREAELERRSQLATPSEFMRERVKCQEEVIAQHEAELATLRARAERAEAERDRIGWLVSNACSENIQAIILDNLSAQSTIADLTGQVERLREIVSELPEILDYCTQETCYQSAAKLAKAIRKLRTTIGGDS